MTGLQPVDRHRLLERRGLLTAGELAHLGRRLTVHLGLDRPSG